jgi:hypothetical protein
MTTAPAALSRCTVSASASGRQSRNFGLPQVVGRPATLNCSFTVIGRPRRGRRSPRANAASAAYAASRARSKSRTTTALMLLSRASMRTIAKSVSSTAEMLLSASAASSAVAVRYSKPVERPGSAPFSATALRHGRTLAAALAPRPVKKARRLASPAICFSAPAIALELPLRARSGGAANVGALLGDAGFLEAHPGEGGDTLSDGVL